MILIETEVLHYARSAERGPKRTSVCTPADRRPVPLCIRLHSVVAAGLFFGLAGYSSKHEVCRTRELPHHVLFRAVSDRSVQYVLLHAFLYGDLYHRRIHSQLSAVFAA